LFLACAVGQLLLAFISRLLRGNCSNFSRSSRSKATAGMSEGLSAPEEDRHTLSLTLLEGTDVDSVKSSFQPMGPACLSTTDRNSIKDETDVTSDIESICTSWTAPDEVASICTSWTAPDEVVYPELRTGANPGGYQSLPPLGSQEHILRERSKNMSRGRRDRLLGEEQARRVLGRSTELSENVTSNPVQQVPVTRARETGREASEQLEAMHTPCAFPPIEEHDQEPAHSHETLSRVLAHYNTLSIDNGQIGAMLKGNNIGFANVPIASLVFSSRPLIALAQRWPIWVVTMGFGVALQVMACLTLERSLSTSSGTPMRWLEVGEIRAYENVFPDLSSNDGFPTRPTFALKLSPALA
jgi:hypothetical protein